MASKSVPQATKMVVLNKGDRVQACGKAYATVKDAELFAQGHRAPGVGWLKTNEGWVPAEYHKAPKVRKRRQGNSRRASRCVVIKPAFERVFA